MQWAVVVVGYSAVAVVEEPNYLLLQLVEWEVIVAEVAEAVEGVAVVFGSVLGVAAVDGDGDAYEQSETEREEAEEAFRKCLVVQGCQCAEQEERVADRNFHCHALVVDCAWLQSSKTNMS